ncbi:MAG: hypothetical protein K0Q67_147 [Cellvibrio sp.]|nr:hypothetical protein [Cellvibrio sp.]
MKAIFIKTAGTLALTLMVQASLADCVADLSTADARKIYQEATQLEAAGKLWDALLKYDTAQGYVCDDGGNPVAKQALDKAITLGSQQGKLEEQKGNFYKDGKPAGAFQWYERGAQFVAADRALIAALKKDPANIQVSAFAQEHFKVRGEDYFAANNKSAVAASGGYQLDKSYDTYVRSLPPTNIDRLLASYQTILPDSYLQAFAQLAQQKDVLQPGDIAGTMNIQQQATLFYQQWKTDRIDDIRNAFDEAHSWTQQVRDYKEAEKLREKIAQARLAHADRMMKNYSGTLAFLESAIEFYNQYDKEPQLKTAQQKAAAYADQAMAAGQYERSSQFYSLIGDHDKEQQARNRLDAQNDQLARDAQAGSAAQLAEMQKMYSDPKKIQELQKQAQEMQKQMEAQQKNSKSETYQKESDELEEELGL